MARKPLWGPNKWLNLRDGLILVLGSVMVGMFIWVYFDLEDERELLNKEGLITGGHVISFSMRRARYIYYVEGVEYKGNTRINAPEKKVIGFEDYYEVTYLPNDPTIKRIDFFTPMILFEDPDGNLSFEYITYEE